MRYPWSLLAAGGVAGFLVLRATRAGWTAALPDCTFRAVTGLHCPGCGGTRCANRLLEGDLAGALSMNAAVVLLAAVAMAVTATGIVREWRGRAAFAVPAWLVWGIAGFVLLFALTRNLPWWPFTLLAPH